MTDNKNDNKNQSNINEDNNELSPKNENEKNCQNDINQNKKEEDDKSINDKKEENKEEEEKSQGYLNENSNSEQKIDNKDDDSSESDNEDSVKSLDSNDEKYILERMKYLENPQTFQKKREFFAFYAKHRIRQSVFIPEKNKIFKRRRMNSQIIEEIPEFKRYNHFELRPRGFGINIKEKIEFFEKKALENQYKPLNLTQYQRKYYDNNEPRQFDLGKLKVINIAKDNNNKEYQSKFIRNNYRCSVAQFSFGTGANNQKKKDKKLNLNLNVDYSKILNSAKVNKSEKGLDLFMTDSNIKDDYKIDNKNKKIKFEQKQKNKHNLKLNQNSSESDSDFFSSIKEPSTTTTNTNIRKNIDLNSAKTNKPKTRLYSYNDLISKISAPITLKNSYMSNFNDDLNLDSNKGKSSKNNNTYVLVKKNNRKMSLEKKSLANIDTGVKKEIYQKVSDNLTLNRLDNAKHKLNIVNNNQKIKRQIIDMIEQLVIDKTNNKCKEKINNKYDKQKLNRAFEIISKLTLIKDKFNSYLESSENLYSTNYKSSFDEKTIKQSVSTIYFLECLGLEPIILFNENETISNKQFVNDVNEDFQLNGINNRKKYIKYYLQNMNKANYLIELLINKILHLQSDINKNKKK
jgi:hypothetical protein